MYKIRGGDGKNTGRFLRRRYALVNQGRGQRRRSFSSRGGTEWKTLSPCSGVRRSLRAHRPAAERRWRSFPAAPAKLAAWQSVAGAGYQAHFSAVCGNSGLILGTLP